jgi:hypothetical protein
LKRAAGPFGPASYFVSLKRKQGFFKGYSMQTVNTLKELEVIADETQAAILKLQEETLSDGSIAYNVVLLFRSDKDIPVSVTQLSDFNCCSCSEAVTAFHAAARVLKRFQYS